MQGTEGVEAGLLFIFGEGDGMRDVCVVSFTPSATLQTKSSIKCILTTVPSMLPIE